MTLFETYPVFPSEEEILPPRKPIRPAEDERSGFSGFKCSFCDRYYPNVGESGVIQIDVTKTGKVEKRWGGGFSVWRCGRCAHLGISLTLDGMRAVQLKMDASSKSRIRDIIVNKYTENLFRRMRAELWS